MFIILELFLKFRTFWLSVWSSSVSVSVSDDDMCVFNNNNNSNNNNINSDYLCDSAGDNESVRMF